MRIELSDIAFRYEHERVLQNIDVTIPSGGVTVFCGETGSGKSTLLQVISGLEKPSGGTIEYSEPDVRRYTGIVFQSPDTQIFAGTVQQDIEYGLELRGISKVERAQKAKEALARVGLEPELFWERSPHLLSGGEKRRVVIAGALALEPKLLILDEPTAGLDPVACRQLVDVLRDLRADGLTIVVSTHDLDLFFPMADHVCVMREGKISFQGSAQELVAAPSLLAAAGLEMPAAARIAYRLRNRGLDVTVPIGAEELVAELRRTAGEGRCRGERGTQGAGEDSPDEDALQRQERESEDLKLKESESVLKETSETGGLDWNFVQAHGSFVHRLDSRMKWFGMVVLSFALLQISNVWGVWGAVALLVWLMRIAHVSWRKMIGYLRPFFIMFSFIWLVSAVSFDGGDVSVGPVGISYEGAVLGGLGVIRFLFVIALGLLFTETTTGAPLREGFEWGIRPLRKWKVPTRDLSLAVSVALQFLPWILEKLVQLRKAFASRGQDTIGVRKWTPRQVAWLIFPLLIIVIKMGDELATAIESRGYDKQVERTSWYQLCWTGKDTAACLLMAGIAGLFWWLA